MAKKIRVVQIGLGARGKVQLNAFLKNSDRFEVVGIYNSTCKKTQIINEMQKPR